MSYILDSVQQGFFPTPTTGGHYNQAIIVRFTTDAYPDGSQFNMNVTVEGTDTVEEVITKCEDAANARLTALYGD